MFDEDENFESHLVSYLYICCNFYFFIQSDAATKIIFPALRFNPNTCELSLSQCEGLSQASPTSPPALLLPRSALPAAALGRERVCRASGEGFTEIKVEPELN